ncbi:MAG: hypothetical protein JNK45_13410 [Myxococcales bacterium]|nr:hypothetical protein [Myxococcales bacterium]
MSTPELPSVSVRWLHALALVSVSCTAGPGAGPEAGDAAAARAQRPSILPTRSLAIEADRGDMAPPL